MKFLGSCRFFKGVLSPAARYFKLFGSFFFYRWFYHNGRMCFDPFSPVGFQRKFFQRPVQAPNFLLIFYLFIPILQAFLFLLFWWVKIGKDLNVSRCFFKKKDFFSTSTFFSAFFTSSVQTPPFFF